MYVRVSLQMFSQRNCNHEVQQTKLDEGFHGRCHNRVRVTKKVSVQEKNPEETKRVEVKI